MNRGHQTLLGATIATIVVTSLASRAAAQEENYSRITAISPITGPVGTVVTITGVKLDQTKGIAFWGNVPASFTIKDATTVTTIVPSGAASGRVLGTFTTNSSLGPQTFTVTGQSSGGGGGGGNTPPPPPPWIAPPSFNLPATSMTGHPRIFLTQQDLPTYQSWANSTNPIWANLYQFAIKCRNEMDMNLVPAQDDGQGLSNYNPYTSEAYAEIFAFMSLVDPNVSARPNWAKRAHDLLMYPINIAALGLGTTTDKFRMPHFMEHNRSRWYGECWATTLDWCYSTFSSTEKATIRKVFLRWVQENIWANATSSEHPHPEGVVNSPSLTANTGALRWAGNNYYCNHARNIGLFSMAMDDVDDVPTVPGDPSAGTLRAYIGNSIGSWLYQVDALEKGELRGGFSQEGLAYGESDTSAIAMLLGAMHTTQTDLPGVFGQQADMIHSPWWSQQIQDAFINSTSPAKTQQYNWAAASYLPADYGDVQNYQMANWVRTWSPLLLTARSLGDVATEQKLRYMIENFQFGGSGQISSNMSNLMQTWGPTMGIFYFMSLSPSGSGVDPRPTMPVDYYGAGLGILRSRTDWSPLASYFTYKCSWNTTDHQQADGNMFEFYRKGEWMTKNRTCYGFHAGASVFKNTLAIQNPTTSSNWFWAIQSALGSQYSYANTTPKVNASFGPGFAYAQGDSTNLYNGISFGATDVAHASRSMIWLKPDLMVCYDRATSKSANRFKQFWLNTQLVGTVNGNLTTTKTPKGQNFYVRTVLPLNANISTQFVPTSATGPDAGETVQGEPMQSRILVTDNANGLSAQFLHVMEGADAGVAASSYQSISSTSGDAFDGVAVKGLVVMFCQDITKTFGSVTFSVPIGTTQTYVAGLTPGAGYTVSQSGGQVTITAGGTSQADLAGLLHF